MKKHLALLLAAAMVLTTVPSTAFAGSSNRISRVATVEDDAAIKDTTLIIENKDGDWTAGRDITFVLSLTNAEWLEGFDAADVTLEGAAFAADTVKVTQTTAKEASITIKAAAADTVTKGKKVYVNLDTKATDEGDATVTLDARDSELSGGTFTFAKVSSGSTTTTIEKKTDVTQTATAIKSIVIDESVVGTFKPGEKIKLRLSGEFEFGPKNTITVSDVAGRFAIDSTVANTDKIDRLSDDTTIEITLPNDANEVADDGYNKKATGRSKLSIGGITVYATDDANSGDIAEITVSGAGVDKATVEVATYLDYGVAFTVEDKELPVIYSGKAYDVDDTETLEVQFKENVPNSWIDTRKTKIIFPKEVRVNGVDFDEVKNIDDTDKDKLVDALVQADGSSNKAGVKFDKNEIELIGPFAIADKQKKREFKMTFNVSVEPGFTGDITATLTGAGIGDDQTITVAKAEMPITVETKANELKIDYRRTAINDLVIKEAYAGALEKDDKLVLSAEYMTFEDKFTYEVTAGDIKVDDVEAIGGNLVITIDKESVKTPGEIKISGLSLYMDRNLAAGDYKLSLVPNFKDIDDKAKEVIFENFDHNGANKADNNTRLFDTDEVVVIDKFVKVITAGRDQDDATFTKQLKVTIGAETMTAGDNEINLNGAVAYISEDNYTMLPVRAITEALSDVATVTWDAASRRVTIIFGSRIIGMTIGSNEMTINGTVVPMSSKAVIKNDWTYVPLRDLGYALGLGNDKINWDDATKTATLN